MQHTGPTTAMHQGSLLIQSTQSGMSTGDWIAVGGDILVLVGLLLTLVVFLMQRASSAELLRQSALAVLNATRTGIGAWGPLHFGTDYSGAFGDSRAHEDYDHVINHRYQQNFRVPTEPLATVLVRQNEGRFISAATISAVSVALWRIGQFNQSVQQQADFNARHLADIIDDSIHALRRQAIARSAETISRMIHVTAIGDGGWYSDLVAALDKNIADLSGIGRCRWWQLRTSHLPGT
jgi:hypothetical protein